MKQEELILAAEKYLAEISEPADVEAEILMAGFALDIRRETLRGVVEKLELIRSRDEFGGTYRALVSGLIDELKAEAWKAIIKQEVE